MSVTFKSNVKAFYDEFDTKVKQCLEVIGLKAEAHAKGIITAKGAVETGRLRNSITHQVGEQDSEPCVYVGSDVEYANYVENGTSRMKKRPYLKPAIEDFKDEYKEICKDFLGDI